MYDTLNFANPVRAIRTIDRTEAVDAASKLSLNPITVPLSKVEVNENGTISIEGSSKTITMFGFEQLCKHLGLPRPFARKIPLDLLFTNVGRLIEEHSEEQVVFLERMNGELAGVVKFPFMEVSALDFISTFSEKDSIKYFDVGETLSTICLGFDPIYPEGFGSDVHIGSFLYNSTVRVKPLHLFFGLFKSSCENSFVAPYMGKVRANYKLEDATERLLAFSDSVLEYDDDVVSTLKERFRIMESRTLFRHEKVFIWKKLNRLVGDEVADTILRTNEEERKVMIEVVSQWSSGNKRARLLGEAIEEPTLTSTSVYDVINDITNYPIKYDVHEVAKQEFELLGGKIIEQVLLT